MMSRNHCRRLSREIAAERALHQVGDIVNKVAKT